MAEAICVLIVVFAVLGIGAYVEQRTRARRSADWCGEGGIRR